MKKKYYFRLKNILSKLLIIYFLFLINSSYATDITINTADTTTQQDLDGDGVADSNDLCPDVPGTIANKGCPNKNFDKSVYLRIEVLAQNIKFERTKNTLSNKTMDNLDGILKIMQEYPATKFEIASHTDDKHNEKYSLFLSKRRANAVMKYLIDGGIQEERLTSEGYGDTEPKFSNTGNLATSEMNNRIEFNFKN